MCVRTARAADSITASGIGVPRAQPLGMINTVEMYCHYAMGYYQNVDKYIAVSRFYRNKMIEYGFPESQVEYLPNYVEVKKYDPPVADGGYALYFGRLAEEKGISVLLDAAAITPEVPFFIAGDGPLAAASRKRAIDNEMNNIVFLGFKAGSELRKLLTEATCVIVPSEWYENCPMNVLESFAAGKPVIGSDIGGIPELIDKDVNGFTFQPGNAHELASKVRWIFGNRSKSVEMGMEGRKKVSAHFNAVAHYDGLMSIYNSVLGH